MISNWVIPIVVFGGTAWLMWHWIVTEIKNYRLAEERYDALREAKRLEAIRDADTWSENGEWK